MSRTASLRPAALAAGALGVGALCIHAALPGIVAGAPHLVARYAPDEPAAWYRPAAAAYAQRPGRLPDAVYARARAVAAARPLSADPFVIEATRAIADDDGPRATRLLEEARRRDPRQRLARVLLIERYVRENRLEDASMEIATIVRLTPEASPVLVDALTKLAVDPAASAALVRSVRGDPLVDALLARLVEQGASTAAILRLTEAWRPSPQGGAWRSALMNRMIAAGDYRNARAIWARFGNAPPEAATQPIFNTGFVRSPALPPFNWRLSSSEAGVAEIGRRRTLSVDFYGRQTGSLATLLATFAPGSYVVGMSLEGASAAQGSTLAFGIRCNVPGRAPGDGLQLLSVPISGTAGARRVRARFTVPGGCGAQWITIDGIAGEFPATQSVEISDLSFARSTAQ